MELAALECFEKNIDLNLGKVVAILAPLFFIGSSSHSLAGNVNNQFTSDELENWSDPVAASRVICPLVFKNSMFSVVTTLAASFYWIFFILDIKGGNHNISNEFLRD